jgi:hypothetical protein
MIRSNMCFKVLDADINISISRPGYQQGKFEALATGKINSDTKTHFQIASRTPAVVASSSSFSSCGSFLSH